MSEIDAILGGAGGSVAADPVQTEVQVAKPVKGAKVAKKVEAVAEQVDSPAHDRSDNDIVMEQNDLMRGAKRVKIRLEQNKEIPPTGQFIGVNGVGYLLVAGVEVEVPEFLLDALDAAVESVPVFDERGNITGYQNKSRFPYQIVRDRG